MTVASSYQFVKVTRENNRMSLQIKHKRIAVTRLGVISPVGIDPENYVVQSFTSHRWLY